MTEAVATITCHIIIYSMIFNHQNYFLTNSSDFPLCLQNNFANRLRFEMDSTEQDEILNEILNESKDCAHEKPVTIHHIDHPDSIAQIQETNKRQREGNEKFESPDKKKAKL